MSYIGWIILIVCVLSFGGLFFAVNAIALHTFSSAKLHEAFKQRGRSQLADKFIESSEQLSLTCSLYRLVLNACIILVLLAAFRTGGQYQPCLADFIIVFAVAMAIYSIMGLAIPHAWAKYAGEKILCRTYPLLHLCAIVAWPALKIFKLYDELIKRLAGIGDATEEELQEEKEEEFLTDLEKQKIEGVVDEEEQIMIENVLDLSDTTAGEIITPRTDLVAIDAHCTLSEIVEIIKKAGHSRYPVFEETIDKIIGMVYAKDLLTELGKAPGDFKLTDKIRQAYFVPETKPLRELLNEFKKQKLHIAVVLDEYGGTAGIITLEDIIEQLVGEISDEYEKTPPEPVVKIDPHTIEADARIYIDDLNDKYDFNLPEDDDYDTIGGFVFSHLGYIPKTGTEFDYADMKFTIALAEARKIKRVRIRKQTGLKNA
ncbi:MAG: hemolysin family protein [Phycisphaerae bacterium]